MNLYFIKLKFIIICVVCVEYLRLKTRLLLSPPQLSLPPTQFGINMGFQPSISKWSIAFYSLSLHISLCLKWLINYIRRVLYKYVSAHLFIWLSPPPLLHSYAFEKSKSLALVKEGILSLINKNRSLIVEQTAEAHSTVISFIALSSVIYFTVLH
jgi:hypothetical protein